MPKVPKMPKMPKMPKLPKIKDDNHFIKNVPISEYLKTNIA